MSPKNNLNLSNGVKAIIDLDYTLLDTDKFKKALAEIFKDFDFEKNYDDLKNGKKENFGLNAFIDFLKENYEITDERIKEIEVKCGELLKRIDEFLFPEAEKLLELLKRNGYEIILATFGRKSWQEQKVGHLSEKEKFDQIIFEELDKSKSEFLKSLIKERETAIIINDNAEECLGMKEVLGDRAKIYLLDGKYSHNAEHNLKIYSLEQLCQYFEKLFEYNQETKKGFKIA